MNKIACFVLDKGKEGAEIWQFHILLNVYIFFHLPFKFLNNLTWLVLMVSKTTGLKAKGTDA